MPRRQFSLQLELSEPEIFYDLNYDPPLPNIGGHCGGIWPQGTLNGISYDELRELGDGTHFVELDEHTGSSPGQRPLDESEDDKVVRTLRFIFFAERIGAIGASTTLCHILFAITPKNIDRIRPLLSERHIEQLKEFAKTIAATKTERDTQGHMTVSSLGSTPIPDENLIIIRALYGQPAG